MKCLVFGFLENLSQLALKIKNAPKNVNPIAMLTIEEVTVFGFCFLVVQPRRLFVDLCGQVFGISQTVLCKIESLLVLLG